MARLTAENESLMDISNALSAEKRQAVERLEAAAKAGKRNTLGLAATVSPFSSTMNGLPGMSSKLVPAWTFLSIGVS